MKPNLQQFPILKFCVPGNFMSAHSTLSLLQQLHILTIGNSWNSSCKPDPGFFTLCGIHSQETLHHSWIEHDQLLCTNLACDPQETSTM